MKLPKGFNRMKQEEKIEALVKRLQSIHEEEERLEVH